MLNNYEELLQSRTICEGKCALGEQCPTGLCRSSTTQKRTRRRTNRSHSEMRRSPSSSSTSSNGSTNNVRPRSGPAGLRSYTGIRHVFYRNQRNTISFTKTAVENICLLLLSIPPQNFINSHFAKILSIYL